MTLTKNFNNRPTISMKEYHRQMELIKELLEAGYSPIESVAIAQAKCPCGTEEPAFYKVQGIRVCSECHGNEFPNIWD